MKNLLYIFLLGLIISQCRNKDVYVFSTYPDKPTVPSSLKQQHESLIGKLSEFTSFGDSTARAALKLKDLMQHHFTEEEDYVLPPLGVLPLLASGKLPDDSKRLIELIERLKTNSTHIIAEHQMVKAFVDELMLVAAKEKHPEIIGFENELYTHAMEEEEIFFPTVLLIGEFLRLKTST